MYRILAFATVLLALFSCTSAKSPPSPSPSPSPTEAGSKNIAVALKQWEIAPTPASGLAGKISFAVTNGGTVQHEFVIFKTDLAPDKLPLKPDRSVDEEQLTNAGEGGDLKPGESKTTAIDLVAGNYVFVCNRVDDKPDGKKDIHYQLGMRTPFVVR